MKISVEGAYPLAVSALAALTSLRFDDGTKLAMATQLANPMVNIMAITVGFLAAAMTVLLTAQDLGAIQRLRTSNAFRGLVNYHWNAITVGLVAALLSLVVGLCFPPGTSSDKVVPASWWLFHAWFFVVVLALTSFYRVVRLLKSLLCPPE